MTRRQHANRAGHQVHQRLLAELRSRSIATVRTDVIFGTAKRPG